MKEKANMRFSTDAEREAALEQVRSNPSGCDVDGNALVYEGGDGSVCVQAWVWIDPDDVDERPS